VLKRGHEPQRTCLGCGQRGYQKELIRLSLLEGQLMPHPSRGRGGYLHRSADCWQLFLTRKSHYRAFRAEVDRAAKARLIELLKDRIRE
jgi:predicted RNA-binding protein YlxR (DUF448 family)